MTVIKTDEARPKRTCARILVMGIHILPTFCHPGNKGRRPVAPKPSTQQSPAAPLLYRTAPLPTLIVQNAQICLEAACRIVQRSAAVRCSQRRRQSSIVCRRAVT
ncbi:hypothetical protein Bbelb_095870 [Branchiostoma belcheri]|nr:hypothetical protein Bbelb_095870 [Branchiostoma belcheri]